MIMIIVRCPFSYCHLSIKQVPLQSLLCFSIYGPDRQHLWTIVKGDNSINIQGRIMVHGFCPSPHCHLSIYQVLFKWQQGTGRTDGRTDGRTTWRLYDSPFGKHNKWTVCCLNYGWIHSNEAKWRTYLAT